jgi:predicted HAD superfamily Cof-like phosphohydrolase
MRHGANIAGRRDLIGNNYLLKIRKFSWPLVRNYTTPVLIPWRGHMNNQEMVAEFSRATGGDTRGWKEWAAFRKKLLIEECQETCDALDALGDEPTTDQLVCVLKELSDVLYITYGTALPIGDLDHAFWRVHVSNMSKVNDDGVFDVRADGKVLKGLNYRSPVLTEAIY